MKLLAYALWAGSAVSIAAGPAAAADITGAGATFPFPVYSKWAEAYKRETGIGLNYQSIGSGGGFKQIQDRTADFGATDGPVKGEDLKKHGLVQFPTVVGGVVPVVNLQGVAPGQVKLTGELLADIFQGKIARWSDPRIAALNADVKLPNAAITPVYRSDASGTTSVFTSYLAQVSRSWQSELRAGTTVSWPVGQGGKGNEGVAATVKQVPNAIGYVEYAYAKQNGIPHVLVRNRAGQFPQPEEGSFKAAAAHADWSAAPGFGIALNDQPGDHAWPITAATFILVPQAPDKPERTAEVLKFFDWAYRNGAELAAELDYVPLPDAVVERVRNEWRSVKDDSGQPVYPR